MMGLMVEQMDQQRIDLAIEGRATGVLIAQHRIEIGIGQRFDPGLHAPVDHLAPHRQGRQRIERPLIKGQRLGQITNESQGRPAVGILREPLEPDRVGHDQMIQRPENRTEEGPALGKQRFSGKLASHLVQALVHPGVIPSHQSQMSQSVHHSPPRRWPGRRTPAARRDAATCSGKSPGRSSGRGDLPRPSPSAAAPAGTSDH